MANTLQEHWKRTDRFVRGKVFARSRSKLRTVAQQADSGIALCAQKTTDGSRTMVVVGCKALLNARWRLCRTHLVADRANAALLFKKLVVFVRLHAKTLAPSVTSTQAIMFKPIGAPPCGLLNPSARPAKTLKAINLRSAFGEVRYWLHFIACSAPLKPFGSFWAALGKVVMPAQVIKWLTLNPSKTCSISWGNVCLAATAAFAKSFLNAGHYALLVLTGKPNHNIGIK